MNLQTRLSLTTASTAILALIVVLLVSSYAAKTTLEEAAREKLAAVESSRYRALQRYLDNIQAELRVLALAPNTSDSLNGFSQAYAQLGENAQIQLQQRYVAANDLPRQERDRFETTGAADAYDTSQVPRACSFCGRVSATIDMHDRATCHRCAEQHLHVIY